MAEISSDALKVLDQAGAGAQDYVLGQGGFGGKLTSGEATRLLSGFTPTAMSGDALVQAATTPTARPDFTDPFGARDSIATRLGLTEAQTAENAIADRLRQFQTKAQQEQQAIQGNRDLAMGLSQGFQNTSIRNAALGERGILDELNLARNQRMVLEGKADQEYQVFQNELNTRRDLVAKALQYGDKGVDVNMSVDELTKRAVKAQDDYTKKQEKKAKEEAEKQAKDNYKKTLKAALIDAGLSTKNKNGGSMNTKEMEKALASSKKSVLDREKKKFDLEMKKLEKEISNVGSSKVKDLDVSDNGIKKIIEEEYNSGNDWATIAAKLEAAIPGSTRSGGTADKYLQNKFLGWDY